MKNTLPLKKNEDFRLVYKNKKSKADKFIVVYSKENGLETNRLGISVSKKVGNSVIRHRLKRIIKESYRLSEDQMKTGYDIVVVARRAARESGFKEISNSLLFLLKLLHIKKRTKN